MLLIVQVSVLDAGPAAWAEGHASLSRGWYLSDDTFVLLTPTLPFLSPGTGDKDSGVWESRVGFLPRDS